MSDIRYVSLKKCFDYIALIFLLIYVFFWDIKYFYSRYVFMGLLVIALFTIIMRKKIVLSTTTRIFCFIFIWTLVGVLGNNNSYGFKLVTQMATCLVVYISIQRSEISWKTVVTMVTFCSLIYILGMYVHLIAPDIIYTINSTILTSDALRSYQQLESWNYYTGISGFNHMSSILISVLVGIYLCKMYNYNEKKSKRVRYAIVAIGGLIGIIIAQKRGVFVASALAVIFMTLLSFANKNNIKKIFLIGIFIAIFGGAIYVFLQNSESGLQFIKRFSESDDISSGRFTVYKVLLAELGNSFILGKGSGASQNMYSAGAHNIYLQILFDHGIVGIVLYLWWFIYNLRNSIKIYKERQYDYGEKIIYFMSVYIQVLFLAYGFFGNPITDIFIFLLYIFFTAFPYSIRKISKKYG